MNQLKGTISMTETKQEALLIKLENKLALGKKLLETGKTGPGRVRMWTGTSAFLINQIVSGDSVLSQCVPDPRKPELTTGNAKYKLEERVAMLESFINHLRYAVKTSFCTQNRSRVFIGHGRSPIWLELKDFLNDRLGLESDEFNREPIAGITTSERIHQMLDDAKFALLIMTGEDEMLDATTQARQNVVHEIGLFQGRLGSKKAIILLEDGCANFSNNFGVTVLPFPKGRISAVFEDIRKVLEREKILND